MVAGTWYFYPARREPYPDPQPPPLVVIPGQGAPAQYWYYCQNPAAYYIPTLPAVSLPGSTSSCSMPGLGLAQTTLLQAARQRCAVFSFQMNIALREGNHDIVFLE